MGIFDPDDSDLDRCNDTEQSNPYLDDPAKGIQLLLRLLPNKKNKTNKTVYSLGKTISRLAHLDIKNIYSQTIELEKLAEQVQEFQSNRLLMGKSIIGIGGRFSAGKSAFINSLLQGGNIILPENQTPTTSIPTYITYGSEEKIAALFGAKEENLDIEAMQAITHAFYEKYKIGFSNFIANITIQTPSFPSYLSSKAVLLDTPGYNKADSNAKETLDDYSKAEEHLKAADCLIWLADIENGVIKENDIQFIRQLRQDMPVLVVFNKADKKTEENCRSIKERSEKILYGRGINLIGVAVYSSRDRKEYFKCHLIYDFLGQAAAKAMNKKEKDLYDKIYHIKREIERSFAEKLTYIDKKREEVGETIYSQANANAIRSLAYIYGRQQRLLKTLRSENKDFLKLSNKLESIIKELKYSER